VIYMCKVVLGNCLMLQIIMLGCSILECCVIYVHVCDVMDCYLLVMIKVVRRSNNVCTNDVQYVAICYNIILYYIILSCDLNRLMIMIWKREWQMSWMPM
jgi:hypothetical protein